MFRYTKFEILECGDVSLGVSICLPMYGHIQKTVIFVGIYGEDTVSYHS
jgi:hypothetical protein